MHILPAPMGETTVDELETTVDELASLHSWEDLNGHLHGIYGTGDGVMYNAKTVQHIVALRRHHLRENPDNCDLLDVWTEKLSKAKYN